MRLSPALAPAILSTVGGTPGPAYDLLRGDAFRIVGHQSDALRCYAAAAMALAERPAGGAQATAGPDPAATDAPDAAPGAVGDAGVSSPPDAAADAADDPKPIPGPSMEEPS
jgi:hypothetical protein